MEKEKKKDKKTSEQLMMMIKKLHDQKNVLAERLLMLKRSEFFSPSFIDIKNKDKSSYDWEFLHYENVGILHVLTQKQDAEKKKEAYDFEGKYAL